MFDRKHDVSFEQHNCNKPRYQCERWLHIRYNAAGACVLRLKPASVHQFTKKRSKQNDICWASGGQWTWHITPYSDMTTWRLSAFKIQSATVEDVSHLCTKGLRPPATMAWLVVSTAPKLSTSQRSQNITEPYRTLRNSPFRQPFLALWDHQQISTVYYIICIILVIYVYTICSHGADDWNAPLVHSELLEATPLHQPVMHLPG